MKFIDLVCEKCIFYDATLNDELIWQNSNGDKPACLRRDKPHGVTIVGCGEGVWCIEKRPLSGVNYSITWGSFASLDYPDQWYVTLRR